jgi:hypothetical protein
MKALLPTFFTVIIMFIDFIIKFMDDTAGYINFNSASYFSLHLLLADITVITIMFPVFR